MVEPLQLTPEMIAAIEEVAQKTGSMPATVLRRAIFAYAAIFDDQKPVPSNVARLFTEVVEYDE